MQALRGMPKGLSITFDLLTRSDNEAAVQVLIPALDCPNPTIQEGALIALLKRRTVAGGREILDRMSRMKPEWKTIIRQHRGRLTGALRDAILGAEAGLCENGCRAAVMFRDYDLVPTLLTAMDSSAQPNSALAAQTALELVQALCEELGGGRDPSDRRDPQMIRRYVLSSLETSVHRYGQHKRREVIESFLLLAGHENATLGQILSNPLHAAQAAVIEVMSKSEQRGILRLLLSFLDDPHAPSAVLNVIAGRNDARFVHYLLRKIGREPALAMAMNLKKMTSVAWLSDCQRIVEQLDDAGQHSAVRFVMACGIPRKQALGLIEMTLLHGKPGGRREAARALGEFQGTDANAMAMNALADPDPQVQANIIPQLRGRGIPGVLSSLLDLVESPYPVVRKAARESLAEFSFRRFAAAFDLLDEEVRQSTGLLVKKIDTQTIPLLKDELKSSIRSRRLRGLVIARTIDVIEGVENSIIEMLKDEDHLVRMEAVVTLGRCHSPASVAALTEALNDKSEVVRLAAQRSLQEAIQARPTP
jgi:HEAT repeat protein